jgi:hypothetical protein
VLDPEGMFLSAHTIARLTSVRHNKYLRNRFFSQLGEQTMTVKKHLIENESKGQWLEAAPGEHWGNPTDRPVRVIMAAVPGGCEEALRVIARTNRDS